MCIFDEQTNTDLPGEIYDSPDHAYESWKEQEFEMTQTESLHDTGFDERSLDELMTLDIQDRWRELLADADELIDDDQGDRID